MISNLIININMKSFFLILVLFFLIVDNVSATGIGLRPLRTNITIDPGNSKDIVLTVINNENFTQIVRPEFQTYTSHNEAGYPVAKKMEKDDPDNIISWIEFENEKIEVEGNSEINVKATITVPKNAEPGGRYGALIYGPILPNASGVSIRTRVASLLLLSVSGDEKFDGEVLDFKVANEGKIYSDKGINFIVSFKNNGNVHTSPNGNISILNEKREEIASIYKVIDNNKKEIISNEIPVNLYGNFVLPNLKRDYESLWKENVVNGQITAKLNFVFRKGEGEEIVEREINVNVKDDLFVESFDFISDDKKSFFNVKIKNNGTVYERIKGSIDILNEFDYKIAEVVIPDKIDYIAPKETRNFKLDFLDKKLPEGNYTIKSNVIYGFEDKKLDIKSNFGSNSNFMIIGVVGGSVLFIISIIFLVRRKNKN